VVSTSIDDEIFSALIRRVASPSSVDGSLETS
jgi:hypothetical protein